MGRLAPSSPPTHTSAAPATWQAAEGGAPPASLDHPLLFCLGADNRLMVVSATHVVRRGVGSRAGGGARGVGVGWVRGRGVGLHMGVD